MECPPQNFKKYKKSERLPQARMRSGQLHEDFSAPCWPETPIASDTFVENRHMNS